MNILIVTPLFPPQNAVGALRPYSWAKYWSREGHNVDVYTVESYGVESGLNINFPNVKVVSYEVPFISKMAKKWQATNNSVYLTKKETQNKKTFFGVAKKLYREFIDKTGCIMGVRYPDLRDFWARKVINSFNPQKYDVVVSTGCPYSVHRVGYYVKRKNPGVFWIIDWRDLWTLNPYWSGLRIFNHHERVLEKKYHATCDVITVVSDGLKDELKELTETKIITIPNGFDREDYDGVVSKERRNRQSDKLSCVYTGTIYKGIQDITPFLQAVRELLDEEFIKNEQIEFIAAGNVADLLEDIDFYNLKEVFSFKGFVPREEALKMIYNCDVALLLLGKNNKGILTGKLFEYLTLSDYIFGVDFSNESDAGKIINDANAGCCFDSDVEAIKKAVIQKLEDKKNNKILIKNTSVIEQFNRKTLASNMLKLKNYR